MMNMLCFESASLLSTQSKLFVSKKNNIMTTTTKLIGRLILIFTLMIVCTTCNKKKEEKPTLKMSVNNTNPLPYQIVKAIIPGISFTEEKYSGKIGDVAITAVKYSSDSLTIMIPFLKANTYKLSIDIGDKMGVTDLTIREQMPVTNPDQLINSVIGRSKTFVSGLDKLAAANGQTISPEAKTLLTNMVSSFNAAYAKLTAEEKKQLAQYISTNKEIFDSTSFPGSKQIFNLLEQYAGYYRVQIVRVATAGTGFALFTYAPDATGLTKIAGFACAVYLVEAVLETMSYSTRLLLNDPTVPSPDGLINGKAPDFNFQNSKEKVLNVSVIHRTVYNGDINTTIPLLKEILGYLDQFQTHWEKINSAISTLKSFFGFSDGSLTGRAPKVSEVTTYKTGNAIPGNAQNAVITGITNTNITVSASGSGSQLKVTFSTTQSTDQQFSFTCRYTEDGITLEKTYSAVLAVTLPVATTTAATTITQSGATLNGTVNANNQSTTVSFEYGTSTSYGQTINAIPGSVTGTTTTNVTAILSGLTANTPYHFRVKVTGSGSPVYGNDMTFTTSQSGTPPAASTSAATSVTQTGATINGTVNANNLSTTVTFDYGTTTSYGNSITATQSPVTGTTSTSVSASLTGLTSGMTYHFRVKAVNSAGTTTGTDLTFTPGQTTSAPAVTTNAATNITTSTAVLNGTVNANNASTTVTFEYGTTTSYGTTVTAAQSPVSGATITNVSAALSGLTNGTTYHFRIKATNSVGSANGDDMTFTAGQTGTAPTASTTAATSVTQTGATLNGTVNANNLSTTVTFEYGTTTSYGQAINATPNPVSGSSNTSVSAGLTGLTNNITYHFRVNAVSTGGTTNGSDMTFTTGLGGSAPIATTSAASSVTQTGATLNGNVNANNLSTTVTFEYGTTTSYGQTINATPNTVSGSTNTSVSASLSGLTANLTYHFRVKATNSAGTTTGNDMSFIAQPTYGIIFNPNLIYGTVSDNSGNSYKTIQIGTQIWMAENLRTPNIPYVAIDTVWKKLTTPAYCWYNNDVSLKEIYGALYNTYAVNSVNLCPTGWHIPNSSDWDKLYTYLNKSVIAGGKLKEISLNHWETPNSEATNETGFTGLPGGYRSGSDGKFYYLNKNGYFHIYYNQPGYPGLGLGKVLQYNSGTLAETGGHYGSGFSIRCVKD
jgi:uncharacterized protein (TIGR02145 family)